MTPGKNSDRIGIAPHRHSPSAREIMQARVREHMERLSWSESELGRQASRVSGLSISQSTINRLLDPRDIGGTPTLRTVEAVARALRVPVWSLYFDRAAQEPTSVWRVEQFIDAYLALDQQGRETIEHILTLESQRPR